MTSEVHLSKGFSYSTALGLAALAVTAIIWGGQTDTKIEGMKEDVHLLQSQLLSLTVKTSSVRERLAGIEAELRIVAGLQKRVLDVLEQSRYDYPSMPRNSPNGGQ